MASISAPDGPGDDEPNDLSSFFEKDIRIVRFSQELDRLRADGIDPVPPPNSEFLSVLPLPAGKDLLQTKETYPVILGLEEQNLLKVSIEDGLILDANGEPLETQNGRVNSGEQANFGTFLMDPHGDIFISLDRHPVSTFATAAGQIVVTNGRILSVSLRSEIYKSQTEMQLHLFIHALATKHVRLPFQVQKEVDGEFSLFSRKDLFELENKIKGQVRQRFSHDGEALIWQETSLMRRDLRLHDLEFRARDWRTVSVPSAKYDLLPVPDSNRLMGTVHQYPIVLHETLKEELKVVLSNGLLLHANGEVMDTENARDKSGKQTGLASYLMDASGQIYVSNVGHPVCGEPIAAAGKIKINQGMVEFISAESELYDVKSFHLDALVENLVDKGVPVGFQVDKGDGAGSRALTKAQFDAIQAARNNSHDQRLDRLVGPLQQDIMLLSFYDHVNHKILQNYGRLNEADADGFIDVANIDNLLDPGRPYPAILTSEARAMYKISLENGLVRDAQGRLLDTQDAQAHPGDLPGGASFIMDRDRSIYIAKDRRLISPGKIIAAGQIRIDNGVIRAVSQKNDFYSMPDDQVDAFIGNLVANGLSPMSFRLEDIKAKGATDDLDALPPSDLKMFKFAEPEAGNDVLVDIIRAVAEDHIKKGEYKWSKVPKDAQYQNLIDIHDPAALEASDAMPMVSIDSPGEKEDTKIMFIGQKLCTSTGQPWDSRHAVHDSHTEVQATFLMLCDGSIHISNHAELVTWEGVAAAGKMVIHDGELKRVSLNSRIYKVEEENLDQLLHCLVTHGIRGFKIDRS